MAPSLITSWIAFENSGNPCRSVQRKRRRTETRLQMVVHPRLAALHRLGRSYIQEMTARATGAGRAVPRSGATSVTLRVGSWACWLQRFVASTTSQEMALQKCLHLSRRPIPTCASCIMPSRMATLLRTSTSHAPMRSRAFALHTHSSCTWMELLQAPNRAVEARRCCSKTWMPPLLPSPPSPLLAGASSCSRTTGPTRRCLW
mmetsp:Transcript_29923/g.85700  ORF Transcript_29923/g.85700 Transcript_29923/m.85700 type:complete len:203 (-) Transcript_29923:157-765(-)